MMTLITNHFYLDTCMGICAKNLPKLFTCVELGLSYGQLSPLTTMKWWESTSSKWFQNSSRVSNSLTAKTKLCHFYEASISWQ